MSWTPDQYREYLANIARKSKAKGHTPNPGPAAELERPIRDGALGPLQLQKGTGQGFLVRVTSFRTRLLDEDNLCEKYHVDLCRYAGMLPGDSPATTRIEVRQKKTGKGEPEKVQIEIFEIETERPGTPVIQPELCYVPLIKERCNVTPGFVFTPQTPGPSSLPAAPTQSDLAL